ncbi:RNA helicase, partial [Klebsiella pneumoniae]
GFALTQLQRRLASSPEAIYQSLKRRRNRLEDKLAEMKLLARGQKAKLTGVAETLGSYTVTKQLDLPDNWDELDEDLSAEEYELYAEQVADQATAAETILELDAEILSLKDLEQQALLLVQSGNDKKWEQLSALLQDSPEMKNRDGSRRKLIIFTEHKDTLNYLRQRVGDLLGQSNAVRVIYG